MFPAEQTDGRLDQSRGEQGFPEPARSSGRPTDRPLRHGSPLSLKHIPASLDEEPAFHGDPLMDWVSTEEQVDARWVAPGGDLPR